MNTVTLELKSLARRLMAIEAHEGEAEPDVYAALQVCRKLRQPLINLTGVEGFRMLLARALALARAQEPSLRALRVHPDGSLDLQVEVEAELDRTALAAAMPYLIANLLGLLTTFIGQSLTYHMLRQAWPNLNIDATGSDL